MRGCSEDQPQWTGAQPLREAGVATSPTLQGKELGVPRTPLLKSSGSAVGRDTEPSPARGGWQRSLQGAGDSVAGDCCLLLGCGSGRVLLCGLCVSTLRSIL